MKKSLIFILALTLSLLTSCGGCGGGGGDSKGSYNEPNALSPDTTPPEILAVKAVSDKKVNLIFSENIDKEKAFEIQNYSVYSAEETVALNSVTEGSKTNSLDLDLKTSMKNSEEYTLIAKNISDTNGNRTDTLETKFIGRGPVSVILSDIPALSNKTALEITASGEDIVSYQYMLDNSGSWSDEKEISENIILSELTEGNHTISVIGKDSVGNIQPYANGTSATWKTDLTPPECSLTDTPVNPTNKNDATIRVTGNDVIQYKYNIDSEGWSDTIHSSEPIELSELEDGNHRIEVVAVDSAGNWQSSEQAASHEWTINTSEPAAIITGLPAKITSATVLLATVDSTSAVKYRYSIDAGSWSDITETDIPIKRTGLAENTHTLSVTALNEAGTWQKPENATTYEWKVDTTPPEAEIVSAPSKLTSNTTATFSIAGSDVGRFMYSLDGSDWSGQFASQEPLKLQNISDENHTIKFRGIDSAGNIQAETEAVSYTWKVDTVPPTALLSDVPAELTNSTTAEIIVSGDDIVKFRYILDSNEMSQEISAEEKISLADLSEAEHSIKVIAQDSAGNWQEWANQTIAKWQVDTTPPVFELRNLPPKLTADRSVDITVFGNDIDYYKYKIDNSAYTTLDKLENLTLGNLSENLHNVEIMVYDSAGNTPATPATYSWRVDLTAPTAIINGAPEPYTSSKDATLSISGNEIAGFKYRLNDDSWSSEKNIEEKILLNDLEDSEYRVYVIAVDEAGNWQSEDNATAVEWTVDTVAPAAGLSTSTGELTASQTAEFTVSSTDEDAVGYRYSLDNSDWSDKKTLAEKISLTGLSEQNHTITVSTYDAAGNTGTDDKTATFEWKVDATPPSPPQVQDSGEFNFGSDITFSWTSTDDIEEVKIQIADSNNFSTVIYGGDDGASVDKNSSFIYSASSPYAGEYYARVKVKDKAGNWSNFGNITDGITITGGLTGKIKNTSGSDIAGALIELYPAEGENLITSVSTDSSGVFSFENTAAGLNAYRVKITGSGYSSAVKNSVSVNPGEISSTGIVYLVSSSASGGTITGKVIDANDGKAIGGATVEIIDYRGVTLSNLQTDSSGFTTGNLTPGTYSVKITNNDYFPITMDNVAIDGNAELGNIAISEILTGSHVRIVLLWGKRPRDLDMHVVGPGQDADRFHVWWSKKSYDLNTDDYVRKADPAGSFSTTSLVQDSRSGYGPEAINLFEHGEGYKNGVYTFTVHNYSRHDWYQSQLTLRIYDSEGLFQEIPFPEGAGSEWYWKAFKLKIEGRTRSERKIEIENTFGTLSYISTRSMDWELSDSGLTAFIVSVATGERPVVLGILIGVIFILSILFVWNRKKTVTEKE